MNPVAPIRGRRIRVAVVGVGRISGKHLEAIRQHSEHVELVAVCDTDAVRLAQTVTSTGVRGFSSLSDLLSAGVADVVVLATPSGLHAAQTIEAAGARCHVITEKPMATRWADGKAMVQACDASGVRLFVVKQNRCNPTIRLLKQAIEAGRFGRMYMANVNVFWNRPQAYYDSARWRGTWEYDGGAFMNQASHYVDLLDWLVGPVESIHAFAATLARRIEVEDTGVVNIRWRSGTLGSLNVTMLAHDRNFEGSITLLGERGTVRLGGVALNDVQHWEFAESLPEDAGVKDASYGVTSVYGLGHPLYYENVIATLRGDAEPATDGREGLRSLELLIGIYLSARDGRRVSLPLEY